MTLSLLGDYSREITSDILGSLGARVALGRFFVAAAVLLVPSLMQWAVEVELVLFMRGMAGVLGFLALVTSNADSSEGPRPTHAVTEGAPQPPVAEEDAAAKGEGAAARELRLLSVTCANLEEQTAEVLAQLRPTEECRQVVERLRELLQLRISALIEGAKVRVVFSSPFWRRTPYAAAVPEIEVVVDASPRALYAYMQGVSQSRRCRGDLWNVLRSGEGSKQVLRSLTASLLPSSNGDFRFRRSSFAQQESKVIMVAPGVGSDEHMVAFDLSLNAKWPARNACLVDACADVDGRLRDLLLLVRRWAKVRGMSIACQGYLSPLAWTVLTVYFLQAEGRLPAFLCAADEDMQPVVTADLFGSTNSAVTVAELFRSFVRFYHHEFDWRHERVDIGKAARDFSRKPARTGLLLVDPFQQEWQLSQSVTDSGLEHIRAEFARAGELLETSAAPLKELLEQWVPANVAEEPRPPQTAA